VKILTGTGPVRRLALAPAGRWLASAGAGGLVVQDWPAGQAVWQRPGWIGVEDLTFGPDGRLTIAFGSSWISESEINAGAAVLDPNTGALGGLDSPNRVYALALPEADVFVAVGYTYPEGKTVVRGRLSTGRREERLGSLEGILRFAVLAPSGRRLAVGLDDRNRVSVWDLAPFRQVSALSVPGDITAVALTPAGDALAVAHGTAVTWWDVDASRSRLLEGHAGVVRGLAFSPVGPLLGSAGADGRVVLWHTAGGTPVGTFDWGLGPLGALAFAPDGMTAAAAGEAGVIVVWDVEEG
jgi:WD40 repeat protein